MRITGSTVNLVSERRYEESYTLLRQNATAAGLQTANSVSEFKKALMTTEIARPGAGLENQKMPISDEAEKKITKKKGEETLFTNYNADGGFAITDENPLMSKVSEIEDIRMRLMERILNIMQILYGGAGNDSRGSRLQRHFDISTPRS